MSEIYYAQIKWLREMRDRLFMTQRQMAAALDISERHYHRLESGTHRMLRQTEYAIRYLEISKKYGKNVKNGIGIEET